MAEQATDALEGTGGPGAVVHGEPGIVAHATAHLEHNPGKPMSWVSVTVVIIGFIIGGIAMVPGPHWPIFWIGVGVAVIGCLMTLFTKTFNEDWY